MTSHCNGNHSKTSVSLSVSCRQRTGPRALKLYFTRIVVGGGGGGGGGRGEREREDRGWWFLKLHALPYQTVLHVL